MHVDCDHDALLVLAEPTGPSCHEGKVSCFESPSDKSKYRFEHMKQSLENIRNPGIEILEELFSVIGKRRKNPQINSYTSQLFKEGPEKISKKLIEESGETIIEFLDTSKENNQLLIKEICDLLFHLLVLMESAELELEDIYLELSQRRAK